MSRREEEVLDVATAGGQLLLHLGVEVIVASICCVGLVLTAAGGDESGQRSDNHHLLPLAASHSGAQSLRMANWLSLDAMTSSPSTW